MSGFFKLEAGLGLIPSEDSASNSICRLSKAIGYNGLTLDRLSAIQAFSDSIRAIFSLPKLS